MTPLVIFGAGQIAQLAHYYFTKDSDYDVVAFAVDAAYVNGTAFCGLPLISFDDVVSRYPPESHEFFVALGYAGLNRLRREKYLTAKSLGYRMARFVSSSSSILNGGDIGDNCFILEGSTIQPFVSIGNNVVIWARSHVGHHAVIRDHCFVSTSVIGGGAEIGERCFIGVNATLRDHIRVGECCVIGAGATLLSDAEAGGVYAGTESKRSPVPSARLRTI